MKKIIAVVMSLAMLLTMMTLPALAEGKTVLTVAAWDTTNTPYLTTQEEAFESANPDIDLQYVDVASQEYNTKTSTMLAGGDTTDVLHVKELSDLQNWIAQGYVESLDSYIAADSFDLTGMTGLETYYMGNGEHYGIPYRADFWVLFYNKNLFDAAGVAYPTSDMTWDAYAELARKMTSGEGDTKVYGTHYHTWLSAVANWAVCGTDYTLADGTYDNLAYFYNLVLGLEDDGACMEYNELKAAGLHYSGAFEAGNIAMIPMGYWFVSTMIAAKQQGLCDFDWGFVAIPHAEGVAAGSSFGSPTATCMNKNAANKDAAWKYISWLGSEEGAKVTAASGTRPAVVTDAVAEIMASAEGFPQDDASKAALSPASIALEWPVGEKVSEIKTVVNEEHTAIMSRDVTVDEGIANMNERVAEIKAQ